MVITIILWVNLLVFGVMGSKSGYGFELNTLEGLWLFDDGKGNIAKDSSKNGRDGEIKGAKWVKGKFGTALEFDGVGAFVLIPKYFGVTGAEPRTTMLWWKSAGAREHSWVKWGIVQDTRKYYIRAHLQGAECYLRVETQGGQHFGSTNVCDGNWHHLAVVFPKGSKMVKDHLLYVDGVLEKNTGGGNVGVDTSDKQEVVIGAPLAHHTFALGLMDEVAIFKSDLSESEIKTIMNKGLVQALAVNPAGKLATIWGRIKAK